MKTNWRSIGTLVGEVMRRAEKMRAAADDGARPDEEATPGRLEGGGTAGRAPTRGTGADLKRDGKGCSRSSDGWTVRPPRKSADPGGPASDQGIGRQTTAEAVLPTIGRCGCTVNSRNRESPYPAVHPHLAT